MSSNVGLTTPRGSGTSGYVQRNLSHLKPRDNGAGAPYNKDFDLLQHRQRQPDNEILEHDRKRKIEVKVFELRDKLEDEGYATPHKSQRIAVVSGADNVVVLTTTILKTSVLPSATSSKRNRPVARILAQTPGD
jgi:hypothetical protein